MKVIEETQECPCCGEVILTTANKCKHCGEWFVETTSPKTNNLKENGPTIIINQPTNQKNGIGTAGFVFALISVCLGWVPGVGWFIWLLGLIFSFVGVFRVPKGLAIAGLVISLFDLILLLTVFGALISIFS
jgi:hypothetical protein